MRTGFHLPRQISVGLTDGIGGRQGIIGQLIVDGNGAHQRCRRLPVRKLFPQKRVEYGSRGIQGLQLVLNIQSFKNIRGIINRQVGGIGVIRRVSLFSRRFDGREPFPVMLCQTIRRALRRRGLQIVQIPVLLLVVGKPLPHVVQHLFCKGLSPRTCHILPQPVCVQPRLIHTEEPDGGKMILKGTQIPLCIRIQSLLQQFGDNPSLDLQRAGRNIHHVSQPCEKLLLVGGQIGDPGQIDRDHSHASRALAGAEKAACLLAQLPQIQAQAAAHAAHITGLHVGIDIIGKIRRAVLGCHLKQQPVVFIVGPVEIPCDGISGNGVLKPSSVRVSLDHGLDERPVDQIHLLSAVLIFEVHLPSAHNGRKLRQILRHRPVQRNVGKGRLGTPAAGRVHAVDKGFNALFHFAVA